MKSKSSGGGFLGLFKKKTQAAPSPPAPPPNEPIIQKKEQDDIMEMNDSNSNTIYDMPPRKGSIATTSVLHYTPPGTTNVTRNAPYQKTMSIDSSGNSSSDMNSVVITRKSNILLDDEESVVSTPISQYDDSEVGEKRRKKRVAPPPPPTTIRPLSPIDNDKEAMDGVPPPPPPHASKNIDYEDKWKRLQMKFDEWHRVRYEDGGSIREERIKAEVLKQHDELKIMLEREMNTSGTRNGNNNNNNNNKKQMEMPKKVPQYGNFYNETTKNNNRSQPINTQVNVRINNNPNEYKRVIKDDRPSPTTSTSSTSLSPKSIDENRNEVPKKANTMAVDRLRKEVEEQKKREKEVKEYRSPKEMKEQMEKKEKKEEEGRKEGEGGGYKKIMMEENGGGERKKEVNEPRIIEYKPMRASMIVDNDNEIPPPVPSNPPPRLAEYRKIEQPRMPTVLQNGGGYVRLGGIKQQTNGMTNGGEYKQMNGGGIQQKAKQNVVTPEYASSPQLLRKVYVNKTEEMDKKQVNSREVEKKTKIYAPTSPITPISSTPISPLSPRPTPKVYTNIVKAVQANTPTASPIVRRKQSPEKAMNGIMNTQMNTRYDTNPLIKQNDTKVYSSVAVKSSPLSPKPIRKNDVIPIPSPPPHINTTPSKPQPTTVITVRPTVLQSIQTAKPKTKMPTTPTSPSTFDISDVLKGQKLRKVGMPVEKSGIGLGKVVDSVPDTTRPTTVPPPPPPPPPPPIGLPPLPTTPISTPSTPQTGDLRDSLMSEIREAGRLRAARRSQAA